MITVFQNSILILALLSTLALVIYPSRIFRFFSLFFLVYYMIILLMNDITRESMIFLGSLIILFCYLFWRIFQNTL
jgi:hypothetical protein